MRKSVLLVASLSAVALLTTGCQSSLRTREEPLIKAKSKQDSFAGFALGQNVRHEKFGMGVIIDATHKGEHANLKINFGKNGVKELSTQFAKLESM